MLAQYTAAALVAESRVLSHPASIDSIPTSGSQEDHVSMGWGAGRKLLAILDNIARVIAAELVVAAQAIEFRQPLRPAPGVRAIWQGIRELVPVLTADRPIGVELEQVADFVEAGRLDEICGWKNL
jgi:histidine ammonia-lyase